MRLNFIPLLITLLIGITSAADLPKQLSYRESIDIHLGRNTYVSGELLCYKAYCISNQKEQTDVLSKVAYIELVDEKGQAVLNQVLMLYKNCASSIFQIPDTLATGLYVLNGYTQWMRNFGEENFFSEPIFIYNQYDEDAAYALANYALPMNPVFYVEGGKIVANITNRIIVKVPGLFGKSISGGIIEASSDTLQQTFTTDQNGNAVILIKPAFDTKYKLVLGDSFTEKKSFDIPPAEYAGYAIHTLSLDGESLNIIIDKQNVADEAIRLVAVSEGEIVAELNLPKGDNTKEIMLPIPKLTNPYINIQLLQSNGKIVAEQAVILESIEMLSVKPLKNEYEPHEKIDLEFVKNNYTDFNPSGFSVSVFKRQSADSSSINLSEASANGNYAFLKSKNISLVFPKYTLVATKNGFSAFSTNQIQFPVEDLGVLFTGKVMHTPTNTPAEGVEVNLAIKDTLATILSSRTNAVGCFAMVLNGFGNKTGNISLTREGELLDGNYSVQVDSKFSFMQKSGIQPIALTHDQQFITSMKDEAQRTLIQRAFQNNGTVESDSSLENILDSEPFFGKPQITVYPMNFILLPNFEEISREILPRVRYKQTKSGCEIFVTDIENDIKSEHPVVLLDGVPVIAQCDLFPLTSDDIQRVEIQSGYRVSGNFIYNGLVAVYTTDKYKTKKKEKDERISYSIPGYVNNETIYSISGYVGNQSLAKLPDFRNQLYWNSGVQIKAGQSSKIDFYSSDEEGEYIIDVLGYTNTGYPVHYQQTFKVSDH